MKDPRYPETTAEILRVQDEHFPEIKRFGHPDLDRGCRPIEEREFGTPFLRRVSGKLVGFLREYRRLTNGGSAVAANQLGEEVAMIALAPSDLFDPKEFTVLCNPRIQGASGLIVATEVCISGTHVGVDTTRARKIHVPHQTIEGAPAALDVEDWGAVIVQHELDHVCGIACWQRATPDSWHPLTGGGAETSQLVAARTQRFAGLPNDPPPLPSY